MAKPKQKTDENLQTRLLEGSEGPAGEELVPLGDIRRDPKNENTHPDEQIKALILSIDEFGQTKPLIVNRRNKQIVAGNGTYTALLRMERPTARVQWVDWTAKQQRDYRIADNRLSQMSKFDPDLLQLTLNEMKAESGTLFDAMGLESLIVLPPEETQGSGGSAGADKPDFYAVFVECPTEEEQTKLLALLKKQGFKKPRRLTADEGKAMAAVTGSGN